MSKLARPRVPAGVLMATAGVLKWHSVKPWRRRARDSWSHMGADLLAQFGASADAWLRPAFERCALKYPLHANVPVAFKDVQALFPRERDIALPAQPPWTPTRIAGLQAEPVCYPRGA